MLQNVQSKDRQQPVKIDKPQDKYPGICNLCTLKQHLTIDCPFSTILYHSTNLQNLKSIAQNGFNPRTGRLGKAIYCSDDPSMCVRFVLKNRRKFPNPVLMKIKAMLTNIRTVNNSQEVKSITNEQFKKERIECIKSPYFKVNDQILYQLALYDADYSIVGWSRIKLPQDRQKKHIIQKEKGSQISLPVQPCSGKVQNKMIPEDCKGQTPICDPSLNPVVEHKVTNNQMIPEIEKQPFSTPNPLSTAISQNREQEQSHHSPQQRNLKLRQNQKKKISKIGNNTKSRITFKHRLKQQRKHNDNNFHLIKVDSHIIE